MPWITLAEFSARSPEMNQLCEVSAGTMNQASGISTTPAATKTRIDGAARHAQRAYSPANAHASGRPSDASTSSANVSRRRPRRWLSIAARHRVTTIGSELAIRTCSE